MSTNENKIYIPNFTYPFKKLTIEEEYHKSLSKEEKGNYLFNKFGLWHGGIHFSGQTLSEVQPSEGIRAISDGELVALRINEKYIEDDKGATYSNGFFLLKHYLEYPIGNKLTFFSLYMHTAKKDKYDFSTHKVIGTNRFLRKGISYKEEDKLEELAEDTKITLGEEVGKDRYKVLYVENTPRTDNATIHSTNIKEIKNSFNLKTINRDTPTDIITFPKEKIEIKAGEVIGLIGEYNRSTTGTNEQLHLEVFTKDDVEIFAQKAKEEYEKNKEDKPKPTQIKIPRDIKIYEKKEILIITSSVGYTNLRKAYSKTELGYNTKKVLNVDIKIEIDESTLNLNRYLVTKIEEADVKEQGWTVHKDYIKESFEFKETNNTQSEDKIIKLDEVKKDKDNTVYIELEEKYFLYSDCKELHPITFDWAKIFDVESNDNISIFENLQEVLKPSFFDKVLGNDEEGLKLNSKFKELFDAIDEDSDGNLEIQELEEAVKDITIKRLTSKYIVKHPSEWKYEKDKWGSIEEILEREEDKKHFENENKRIENLQLFDECKSIPDFPQDDLVYHLNPIGLVGEFGKQVQGCMIEEKDLEFIFPNSTKERRKEVVISINNYCHEFEINTLNRMSHFLGQIGTETGELMNLYENYRYSERNIYNTFLRKSLVNHPTKPTKKTYKYHHLINGYNADLSTCPHSSGNYGHNRVSNPIEVNPNWTFDEFNAHYSIKSEYVRSTKLFDYVYGCRMGNGAKPTEDGSDYFGVGFIHLTGKEKYIKLHEIWNKRYPTNKKDFLGDDITLLKTDVDVAMKSAMIFWTLIAKINSSADNINNVPSVTKLVNGGTNGLSHRIKYTKKLLKY